MTIAEFFLKLATDPETLKLFYDDRAEAIRRAELSDAHRQLLLFGSLREIRVKIEVDFEIEGEIVAFGTVYVPPITVYCPQPDDE